MNLNYVVEGKGRAVVFIHGLSDNLNYWQILTSNFKNDYKCIRFDLRGHGLSELGNEEITVDLFSKDLLDLLNELHIDKVDIVGFSLGGCIAMDFAIKYPSKVSSLVIMSSYARVSLQTKNVLNQALGSVEEGFEKFYDFMVPNVLCPDVIEKNKKELEYLKGISSEAANCDGIKKAILACLEFDVVNDLKKIDVPTVILAGKYDKIVTLNQQKELKSNIDNSELIILDNLKHNLLVGKNVRKIIDLINDFLNKRKED